MWLLILSSLCVVAFGKDSLEHGGLGLQPRKHNDDVSLEGERTFGNSFGNFAYSLGNQELSNIGRAQLNQGSIIGHLADDFDDSRLRDAGFQNLNGDDSFEIQINNQRNSFNEDTLNSNEITNRLNSDTQSRGIIHSNDNSLTGELNRNAGNLYSKPGEVSEVATGFSSGSLGFVDESLGNSFSPLVLDGERENRFNQLLDKSAYQERGQSNIENFANSGICPNEKVLDSNGECVEPEVIRNIFFYSSPNKGYSNNSKIEVPKPKIKYDVVVINSKEENGNEPIIVPPPQQKTVVYVLNDESGKSKNKIIEIPAQPASSPEVYFVNYKEGDNPTLPGGIDLKTALANSQNPRDKSNGFEFNTNRLSLPFAQNSQQGIIEGKNNYHTESVSHNLQQESDQIGNQFSSPFNGQNFKQSFSEFDNGSQKSIELVNQNSDSSNDLTFKQEFPQIRNQYVAPSLGQSSTEEQREIHFGFGSHQGINEFGSISSAQFNGQLLQHDLENIENQYSAPSTAQGFQHELDQTGNQYFTPSIVQDFQQGFDQTRDQYSVVLNGQTSHQLPDQRRNQYSVPSHGKSSPQESGLLASDFAALTFGQNSPKNLNNVRNRYNVPFNNPDFEEEAIQFTNQQPNHSHNQAFQHGLNQIGNTFSKSSGNFAFQLGRDNIENQYFHSNNGYQSQQEFGELGIQHSGSSIIKGSHLENAQNNNKDSLEFSADPEFELRGIQNSFEQPPQLPGEFGNRHLSSFNNQVSGQNFGNILNQFSLSPTNQLQQKPDQIGNHHAIAAHDSSQGFNQVGRQNSEPIFSQQQDFGNPKGSLDFVIGYPNSKRINKKSINTPLIQRGSLASKFSSPINTDPAGHIVD